MPNSSADLFSPQKEGKASAGEGAGVGGANHLLGHALTLGILLYQTGEGFLAGHIYAVQGIR